MVRVHLGPLLYLQKKRGCSSAGRALPLQGRGQGFEPPHLHFFDARMDQSHNKNKKEASPNGPDPVSIGDEPTHENRSFEIE